MEHQVWPRALRERLGEGASAALADVLEERDNAVVIAATERFERHLGDQFAGFGSQIKAEIHELRLELRQLSADVSRDLRVELANTRADLLKWCFLFWVGHLAAIAGLVAAMR